MTTGTFPFGRPVSPCLPSADGHRRVFILGAYPSALHVSWAPPEGLGKRIQAIAVDNEPEPFWNGQDQDERVASWKRAVSFRPEWGEVAIARHLNGPSGAWVVDNILKPLAASRSDCWITDCLDTYRCSTALAERIVDTYTPIAAKLGLPAASLAEHPSEEQIVAESTAHHRERLLRELRASAPELIVTLGNAALRVARQLLAANDAPAALSPSAAAYGIEVPVELDGVRARLLPLAHPAAQVAYQQAHATWVKKHLKV